MKQQHGHLRKLVIASLCVALDIIFTRFFAANLFGGAERISLQFLASAVCGFLLGPWWGAGAAVAGDLLGMLINSSGLAIFPGFTLTAALRGFCYGYFLYGKRPSFGRALLTEAIIGLGLTLGLNSVWMTFFFGKTFLAYLALKTPFRLVLIPIHAYIVFLTTKALSVSLQNRLPAREPIAMPQPCAEPNKKS